MYRKSSLKIIAICGTLLMFMSCMTMSESAADDKQQEKVVHISVKITGAGQIFQKGETARLSAETVYNGSAEIEYMWFRDGQQTGDNSDSISLSEDAYSQVPVRLIVKAGNLIAEDSLIVQWTGDIETDGKGENLPGSVIISSVKPEKYLVDGVATEFDVCLAYSIPDNLTADLKIIFNNGTDSAEFRVHDRIKLKGGTGEYKFKITAVPANWEDEDFYIFVLLSAEGYKTGLSARKVLEF